MTFKSTSEAEGFRARVASHSTKGRATGRVDVMPPQARPAVYSELAEQISIVEASIEKVRADIVACDDRRERNRLHDLLRVLKTSRGQYEVLLKAAKAHDRHQVFYRLANEMLPKDTFRQIDERADALIGGVAQ